MKQKVIRQISLFLAVIGIVALLPALYTMGVYAAIRFNGTPVQVVMTRSWLTSSTDTNFNFHRNGRAHQDTHQNYQAEFAVYDANTLQVQSAPNHAASGSNERVRQAVDAVMAKIKPAPLDIPDSAPRFIRDDLPAAVVKTLYPGKVLQAKYSGDTLILADESALILPQEKQIFLVLSLLLLVLSGGAFAFAKISLPREEAATNTPTQDSPALPTETPSNHHALQISSVTHWETNEYEGHIVANWIDRRSDCFFVRLIGDDEWELVQPGKTWVAQIEFECFESIEYSSDGAGFTPQLSQTVGTNYQICGQIQHLDEDSAMLDLPWPMLITDLNFANKQRLPLQIGGWLRATGILTARVLDEEVVCAEPQPSQVPICREMALAEYTYDIGVSLREFLPRLHLCKADEADALIQSGQFKLDGVVLTDPAMIIKTPLVHPKSVAELGQQKVILSFWRDEY